MEVAHGGGTLAEISHSDAVLILDTEVVACTGGLGHLRAQGRRHSDNVHVTAAVVDGHLLALAQVIPVSSQLMAHLLNRKSAPKEHTCFTVLRENQISVVKRRSCADTRRLFAELSHVERNPSLPLGSIIHSVSLVNYDHVVVHLENLLIADLIVVAWRDHVSLLVQHSEALYFVEGALIIHL